MGNINNRLKQLEDALLPKPEVTGPYSGKEVTEEWLVEFCRLAQEHNERYPTDPTFREYSEGLTPEIRAQWAGILRPAIKAHGTG